MMRYLQPVKFLTLAPQDKFRMQVDALSNGTSEFHNVVNCNKQDRETAESECYSLQVLFLLYVAISIVEREEHGRSRRALNKATGTCSWALSMSSSHSAV